LAAAISNNKGHNDEPPESASQMNMRGVFLHVMADALGSVIVIVSASVSNLSIYDEFGEYFKVKFDPHIQINGCRWFG